jgi:hypothetical protein
MNSCALAAEHVSEVLRDLWGTSCQLQDLRDLNDGFAKKTYLLQLRNPDMQCILHIWSKPDHQLTEIETDTDWILGPSGSDLFRVNTEFLRSHGVPTPELFFLDDTKTVCEYDFALVEYIEGGNFTDHNQQCGAGSTQLILDRINEMLMILHAMTAPSPGLLTQRRPRAFERTDLDPNRMKLYALNHSIGWTAFASEAVTGDSVDREWATSVMISNTREVIRLVSD